MDAPGVGEVEVAVVSRHIAQRAGRRAADDGDSCFLPLCGGVAWPPGVGLPRICLDLTFQAGKVMNQLEEDLRGASQGWATELDFCKDLAVGLCSSPCKKQVFWVAA